MGAKEIVELGQLLSGIKEARAKPCSRFWRVEGRGRGRLRTLGTSGLRRGPEWLSSRSHGLVRELIGQLKSDGCR